MATNHPKPYLELKRAMANAGLFSCSQVGFNVALGRLPDLRRGLQSWLGGMLEADSAWDVPPLIRADWIPRGAWDNPPEHQWVLTAPLGHVLTPAPAMHLLNRLRHHPSTGSTLLQGWCTRLEHDTLPLLRQLTFCMLERVDVRESAGALAGSAAFERVVAAARRLELPVELGEDQAVEGSCLRLVLPDTPAVPLASYRVLPADLLAAYGYTRMRADRVGCGIERWCLAVIARYGVDAARWPAELPAGRPD